MDDGRRRTTDDDGRRRTTTTDDDDGRRRTTTDDDGRRRTTTDDDEALEKLRCLSTGGAKNIFQYQIEGIIEYDPVTPIRTFGGIKIKTLIQN